MRLVDFHFGRQWHFPYERSIINLHRQELQGASLVIGWLRKFACATDDDAPRFHGQINERAVDSGQFNADTDAVFAPVRVDRRLPGVPCKPRKLRTRQFVRDIVQCAMQPAQLDVPNWVHRKTKLLPRALHFQSPMRYLYTTRSSTSERGCS